MTATPTRVLRCAWLLLFLAVHCASAWNITTRFPALLRCTLGGDVSAVFEADTALTSCQCRKYNHPDPIIDLSLGRESAVFQDRYYSTSYSGAGLQSGQCGVKLQDLTSLFYSSKLLVCRARAATGGWKHQHVSVVTELYSEFPMTALPQHLVKPGDTAVLQLCKSHDKPLRECDIQLPDAGWTNLYATRNSAPGDKLSYSGLDIARGECTVGLNITADTPSGVVWCEAEDSNGQYSRLATLLLVAAPPSTGPIMTLPSGATVSVGEKLTATCTVASSRPVANITWLIGGRVIRQDHNDDTPDLSWTWPWDQQTITQTLVRVMKAEDHGKNLTCRVQHMALKERLKTSRKLTVTGTIAVTVAGKLP